MDLLTMTVAKYSTQFLALNSEKLKKIWSCYSGIGLNRMSQKVLGAPSKKIMNIDVYINVRVVEHWWWWWW